MEIITSFVLLSFFSFLWFMGRNKDDFILEFLGETGILMVGILMFGTGVQAFGWDSLGVLHMEEIPAVSAVGWLFIYAAIILFFQTYRTVAGLKED